MVDVKPWLYPTIAAVAILGAIGAVVWATAQPDSTARTATATPPATAEPADKAQLACPPFEGRLDSPAGVYSVVKDGDGYRLADGGGHATAEAALNDFLQRNYPRAASDVRTLLSDTAEGSSYGFANRREDGPKLIVHVMRIGDRHLVGGVTGCNGYLMEVAR